MVRERVAVVGSGVSGITAAYLLQRAHDVTLFEGDERLGGHAHTHDVVTPDAGVLAVDTGFIVYNEATYPLLTRLLAALGVASRPAEMSMSIACAGCGLQYAGGRGARGIFATPRSLANPAFVRMLTEVRHFHRDARRLLASSSDDGGSVGDFLAGRAYSAYFVTHFVTPFVAAVWSTAPSRALDYPARYLFQFLANHGMLSTRRAAQWRTVVGGSRTYVERAVKGLAAVHTSTAIRAIYRHADGVDVRDAADELHRFDRVVVAVHADMALRLLDRPLPVERKVLGAFGYTANETLLHRDARVLPSAPRARASWNYALPACEARPDRVVVSYDMNRLQQLPTAVPHLVTLNASAGLRSEAVLARMRYHHPLYTRQSVAAQRRLPDLTTGRVAFAGSYHGWGFHEDGARSGVAAAAAFGVRW